MAVPTTQSELEEKWRGILGPDQSQTQTTNTPASFDDLQRKWGPALQQQPQQPPSILPRSQQALDAIVGPPLGENLTPDVEGEEAAYQQANQIPGRPLDTHSGGSALARLRVGAAKNKMAQLNLLRDMYGKENIRLDTEGNFIFQTKDEETGKPKDVVFDERRASAKDLLDVSRSYPAFGLSILTTKGVPVQNLFQTAWRSAAGWILGDKLTDVASRMGREPIEPGQLAGEAAMEFPLTTGTGFMLGKGIQGLGLLGKFTRLLGSLDEAGGGLLAETGREAAAKESRAAQMRLGAKTGVMMEPTAGELTQNPMIQRLETFLSNIPIARRWVLKQWQRQLDNEKAIQSVLFEKSGGQFSGQMADDINVGQKTLDVLSGNLAQKEGAAGTAADTFREEAQSVVTSPLESIPGKPLSATSFGERMIRRGQAQLQSFKNKANELFEPLRNAPEATQPLFDAAPIQAKAAAIKDSLLKESSGDVAKALSPTGLLPVLDQVERLSPTQSWFDLKDLRNAIYDRIGSPEPISDKGTKMLKELASSVTQEMENQMPSVFPPQLLSQAKAANQFYRENVETFYQKGIAGMLKPRTETGASDPERIAATLLAGGKGSVTTYNTFRDFFEKTGAVKDMNRMLRDQIIDAGTDEATGLYRLEDLSKAVNKMEPEIVQQVFGTAKDGLMRQLQNAQTALRVTGKASIPERGTQAAVEADAFKQMMENPGEFFKNPNAVKTLVRTNEELRQAYASKINQALKRNNTGIIEASPDRFVEDYLLNPRIPQGDAQQAMQQLYQTGDEQLVGDIRRSYLRNLFASSAKSGKGEVSQIIERASGSPLRDLDPQKFAIQLEDPAVRRRMQLILGADSAGVLEDFAKSMAMRSTRDIAGAMQGGLAGGAIFHAILKGDAPIGELAQYSLASYMLTNPQSLKWARAVVGTIPEKGIERLAQLVAASPGFLHSLINSGYSPEQVAQVTRELQAWNAKSKTK